jgi:hypothetical protein
MQQLTNPFCRNAAKCGLTASGAPRDRNVLHENPFALNEKDLIGEIFIGLAEATDVAVKHRYLVKANFALDLRIFGSKLVLALLIIPFMARLSRFAQA